MIVAVSGLPRSGTSMVMQMLAAGGLPILADDSRPADEGNPRGYHEFKPVKALASDTSWLAEAEGKAVKIVAPLLVYLPTGFDYRVILMSRNLDQILASQAKLLRALGRPSADPEVLKPVFARQLDRARLLLRRRNISSLNVEYTAAIANPTHTAHAITCLLGLELDVGAMAGVVEPKLHRQHCG